MLFITHDLRVAAQICDRVAMMRNGVIVETGATSEVFTQPAASLHEDPARFHSRTPTVDQEPNRRAFSVIPARQIADLATLGFMSVTHL